MTGRERDVRDEEIGRGGAGLDAERVVAGIERQGEGRAQRLAGQRRSIVGGDERVLVRRERDGGLRRRRAARPRAER